MAKEAKARIKINRLLEESGWRFFDEERGKANIAVESNTKLTQKTLDAFGNDFEKTTNGFMDFLLLDEKGFPLVVLEAKSEDKSPFDGKEKARRYAQSQNVRFVILSNGNLHYFWDLEKGNPTVITTFPTPESIAHFQSFKPDVKKLSSEKVDSDYIVLSQYPEYQKDLQWIDETTREAFAEDLKLKFLRSYQLKAIEALQKSAQEGNDRFLFEMATGTGKTLASAAVIKLFLRTGNAKRVLFLVDRLELEDQARKNFVRLFKNDYTCKIYKQFKDDWRNAEVVVSTVQSLSFNNKYRNVFSPTDFELIISDEAHRSISGNSRAVFEYFVGYKLGLTATPKDYLKNIDSEKLNPKDIRVWERRQLLDTYKTFGCEKSDPTFRYSLLDGVKDGYLVNPVVSDARTEITTQLLSDEGYSLMVENEEGEETEETVYQKDFEKKFFSEKTNKIFCKTFLEHALRDPVSGEIGKSIVYCVSQNHAGAITDILNIFAEKMFSGKYNSDFAVQVTSRITDAQDFTINFANNNFNGTTKFLEDYKSSKTRACVTVGMMTTGYDCEDILNLCMMRPVFSPTEFIQMKGRGTRKYTFTYKQKEDGHTEETKVKKEKFKLFDFFANYEYFEEKFNYDEVIKLPPQKGKGKGSIITDLPPQPPDFLYSTVPDPLKSMVETHIGLHGMKIDRKLFERFEDAVRSDVFIKENYEKGNLPVVEEYVKTKLFDKPEDFFNLEKLRQSVKADRRITLHEFMDKIFGVLTRFKTKDELLEEEFSKFVSIHKPDSENILRMKNFMKAYITDSEIRDIIDKKDYTRLATNPKIRPNDLKAIRQWREIIPEYIKDYVSLNKFL